jgi:hypothetical protein
MDERDWTDHIVGDRMTVDTTFADRVEASGFSRQEWGLIMTAVEFDITDPQDPDEARLVATTDNLEAVLPEIERVAEMERRATGGGGGDGGILDTLRGALGLDDGDDGPDEEDVAEARRLTQAYADELQTHLHDRGRWTEVCELAATEHDGEAGNA